MVGGGGLGFQDSIPTPGPWTDPLNPHFSVWLKFTEWLNYRPVVLKATAGRQEVGLGAIELADPDFPLLGPQGVQGDSQGRVTGLVL